MHYRATIPETTARHVVVNLLASGQVARMKAGRLVTARVRDRCCSASGEPCVRTTRRPIWLSSSIVAVSSYLSRDEALLPRAIVVPVRQ